MKTKERNLAFVVQEMLHYLNFCKKATQLAEANYRYENEPTFCIAFINNSFITKQNIQKDIIFKSLIRIQQIIEWWKSSTQCFSSVLVDPDSTKGLCLTNYIT